VTARPSRRIGWVLTVTGALGALAAFVLTVEKIRVLEDPSYVPSCSINPILSCGSVMTSDQAEAFGFPNSLIGIAGFSIIAAIGVLSLTGTAVNRRVWVVVQGGVVAGAGFVAWLTFQSLYRIGALCPYCLVVWAVMPPLVVYTTVHNLAEGHLGALAQRAGRLVVENHLVAVTIWYLTVCALVLVRFWDYWRTLP
jgi:uncharacterized membrane protein